MNNSLKAHYRQNMKIVVNLLKVFGRTDPEAAIRTLNDLTGRLLSEIRKSQPDSRDPEVTP